MFIKMVAMVVPFVPQSELMLALCRLWPSAACSPGTDREKGDQISGLYDYDANVHRSPQETPGVWERDIESILIV
jgi:hypothetical protein